MPKDANRSKPNKNTRLYRLKRKRRRKRAIIISIIALVVLALVGGMGFMVYNNLQGRVSTADTQKYTNYSRPTKNTTTVANPSDPFSGALNILLIGSDKRADGGKKSGVTGMRSDTVMIAHISKDRKHVSLISIPRDSWVNIPSCERPNAEDSQAFTGKFNAAFAIGGETGDVGAAVACTTKTIEELTHVYIDDYIVIDFDGFKDMVDALSGVEFDVKSDIYDPSFANLHIKAGKQTFDGKTALRYARVRKAVGMDGSDLGRINRQQELLEAIIKKAKTKTSNPAAMYKLADAGLGMVTTSKELGNLQAMAGLAWSLHGINDSNLSTLTVPIADRGDGENVVWTKKADTLWEMLNEDDVVTKDSLEKKYEADQAKASQGESSTDASDSTESASPSSTTGK